MNNPNYQHGFEGSQFPPDEAVRIQYRKDIVGGAAELVTAAMLSTERSAQGFGLGGLTTKNNVGYDAQIPPQQPNMQPPAEYREQA